MIRVLIVEDSPTVRELLVYLLKSDPDFEIVGTASDGEQAIEAVKLLRPDVVTMDIVMPKMDGLQATRRIMETCPTPIVIVSAHAPTAEAEASFQALEAGALAVAPRPVLQEANPLAGGRELTRTVRLMSEVKVVRRWRRPGASGPVQAASRPPRAEPIEVIGIGGSTGAPAVLESVLARLPGDFPIPVLVVQHMANGFMESFTQWLRHSCKLQVRLARHRESLDPGVVYLAPDGSHLSVKGHEIELSAAPAENGLRPAVSVLFRSLAQHFGARSAAVLLSGMGNDGAQAMKALRDLGAVTIAQEEDSCVVFGMPGEAVRLGAAGAVLTPAQIAPALLDLAQKRVKSEGFAP